ncbi:roadblock/LC7 domain-containing protein [Streptosporangium longisporum]|jgi:predicted regulator of Ras-like GTPase activity (Roadblock/LC7/MglB family)|uniref:Roadblock/LC7 domain-containing protein n=2 Tax=Streptosporangiaceae TaxID=2004 RepID=A0ABN3Y3A5_9ACTN
MLNDIVNLPEVRHAIVLTADGLLDAHSAGITREQAEVYAAAASALQSLSRNLAGPCLGDPRTSWHQTMVEFANGYVIVIAAGAGSYLAVSCTGAADLQVIAYQMHKTVDQLGREMTSPPRNGVTTSS